MRKAAGAKGPGELYDFRAYRAESNDLASQNSEKGRAYLVSGMRRKHDAVQFCEDVAARIR